MSQVFAENLLMRFARTASPYQEKSIRIQKVDLTASVFEVAMIYLTTHRRSVVIDATYGVETTSFLYTVLQSDSRFVYFKSIEQGLLRNDARLKSVTAQDKSYRHATNGTVQYLDILLEIKSELIVEDENERVSAPLSVRIAYDFTGSVFRVKNT